MSVVMREFSSFAEIIRFVDENINSLKQVLAENLRKLEDARVKAEQYKRLQETLKGLIGEVPSASTKEVDLKEAGAKLYVNPDPITELRFVEEAIEKINATILQLQALKKSLEPWASVEVPGKITVVIRAGVPTVFMLKL